jgi:hypothetical protein
MTDKQDMEVLEADGIKVLNMDHNEGSSDLMRPSIGASSQCPSSAGDGQQKILDDSIALWNELEKVKKQKATLEKERLKIEGN